MSALAAYEAALRTGRDCWVGARGGGRRLPLRRWLGDADASDAALLDHCHGPTLDVGCGPGRLVTALVARGVPACGIDVSAEAVRISRARGAAALRRDVFGRVPDAGSWRHVLLADGNIGIGGEVVMLLRRCAEVLAPGGTIVADVEGPGTGHVRETLRLEGPGGQGGALRWARVGADAVGLLAGTAGLRVHALEATADRYVAVMGARA